MIPLRLSLCGLLVVTPSFPDPVPSQMQREPSSGTDRSSPHPKAPGFTLEQVVQTRTLGQFALSPGGGAVAYAVVGYYLQFPVVPRFGEDNNIRVVDLETGRITQVTSGDRPKTRPVFSPSGHHILFESDNDIWLTELMTGQTRRLTMTVFGARNSQPTWSPDGRRIAFISDRGGGTDLWIMGIEGDRSELMQLTRDDATESDPQWSPDGRLIAFSAKLPGEDYMATAIFTVASAGGLPRRLTAKDRVDNFAPRWSPDGTRLAFLSDRNGYVRVWTMLPDGRDLQEFDTGPHDSMSPYWTVRPVWSPDGRQIMVSVNVRGSFKLAVIDVGRRRAEWVEEQIGHYHEVGWRADGSLVYAYENAWSPPDLYTRPAVSGTPRRLTNSSHVMFRREHFSEAQDVSFRSVDGFEVPAFLLRPADLSSGSRVPAIVGMHPNSYGQSYRDNWNPFYHYLVSRGYAVLLVNHRGGAGYGRAFREQLIGNWGTGTFEDVKAGAAFLKSQPFVDPDRVGIMGLSMGGYHTLLALTKTPGLFRAGIDLMGITDLRSPFSPYRVGVSEAENPDLYRRISPITSADQLQEPLLIIHSDQDRNVVPQQTYHLVDELRRLGKAFELRLYYGEAHGLADPEHQLDSYERMVSFFDQHLRGWTPPR
ncbi:MAG TPA: S9 family peptidase [Gemmatimonadaceae bacterium]|nr:S9 family peptidase [Gemmatimonadaceae bacterium]